MTTEYSAIKSAMETNFMKRPLIVTRYDNGDNDDGDDDDDNNNDDEYDDDDDDDDNNNNGYEYGDDN